jgi:hypothetical protein
VAHCKDGLSCYPISSLFKNLLQREYSPENLQKVFGSHPEPTFDQINPNPNCEEVSSILVQNLISSYEIGFQDPKKSLPQNSTRK